MIELKNASPNKTILVAGNRDINKVRMGRDFHIVNSDGTNLFDELSIINDSTELLRLAKHIADNFASYKFLFTSKELNDNFLKLKYNDEKGVPRNGLAIDEDSDTLTSRVSKLYSSSFGASGEYSGSNRFVELKGLISDGYSDEVKSAVICLLNMIMGNVWDVSEDSGMLFKRLNGLYIKYINICHILALGKFNDKQYIFSHFKVPTKLYSLGFCEDMFEHLRLEPEKITDINEMLSLINNDLKIYDFLNINKLSKATNLTNFYLETFRNVFDKLTTISALPDFRGASCSPVVLGNERLAYNGRQRAGYNDNGYANFQTKSGVVVKYFDFSDTSSPSIDFNICGHRPQGIVPTIEKSKTDNFKRIIMDVSKPYTAVPNQNVYALYHMEKSKEDKIIGSFVFVEPVKNKPTDEKYIKKFISNIGIDVTLPHIFEYESTLTDFANKKLIIKDVSGNIPCTLNEYILSPAKREENDSNPLVLENTRDMFYSGEGGVVRPGSLYILKKIDTTSSMLGGSNNYYNKYLKYKNKYLQLKHK